MARTFGEFRASSSYEVAARKPFDARSLVKSYNDLILIESWTFEGKVNAYNGMIVAVANTSDTSKNGLYMLFDPKNTSSLKAPDVTLEDNWIKIGETSDISGFVSRLETIENKVVELAENINDLDSRVDAIEERLNADNVHTHGYRVDFPLQGVVGDMYVANDEGRTYVYTSNGYVHIADKFDSEDHDDNPETPELRIIYGGSAD